MKMKFSQRIAAAFIVSFTVLLVYVFYDGTSFLHQGKIRKSKLVESRIWPVTISHHAVIEDSNECDFALRKLPLGGIHTDYLLERVNNEKQSFRRADPRVLYVQSQNEMKKKKHDKLYVVVIPHSHTDPGWLRTLNDYYEEQTRLILDNIVRQMHIYRNMTFIWGETVFLSMWWNDIDEKTKSDFKALIDEGRLEIVTGGWVAPDEASTTFTAIIDVLLEGHQWILKNLGVKPSINWSPDPFGYSATVPYLLNRAGFENMVILRIHENIKNILKDEQNLEFYWQQLWDDTGDTNIFCHTMPYMLYSIKFSCGPSPYVCLMFDFRNVPGEYSESVASPISEKNVETFAKRLVDQLRKKSEHYRSEVVFMPLGDDFRYDRVEEWGQQYTNFNKLFDFINKNEYMNMDIKFGTLTDYFTLLKHSIQSKKDSNKTNFPLLHGDFYPYTDRDGDYWTGYFTTRPYYKQLARELEANLRAAEILNTLAVSYSSIFRRKFESEVFNAQRLISCRQNLALFQHHDAITGTSKPETISDYLLKLWQVKESTNKVKINAARFLLSSGDHQEEQHTKSNERMGLVIDVDDARGVDDPMPNQKAIRTSISGRRVFLFNPLAKSRREVIRLKIASHNLDIMLLDSYSNPVKCQISPIWSNSVSETEYELSFLVSIPPLGFSSYTIANLVQANTNLPGQALPVTLLLNSRKVKQRGSAGGFEVFSIDLNEDITLENNVILASFSPKNGLLKSITTKFDGLTTSIDIQFLTYTAQGSGAYLFYPYGAAENLDFRRDPVVRIISGSIYSEIHVIFEVLTHIVRLYHCENIQSYGLEIYNYIDIGNDNSKVNINDKEIIMRLVTNIDSQSTFYTDMNGFQIMRRKYLKHLRWQGNYYPMTTMMYLQDSSTRLTLISGQSHGVASLDKGWMEVMLDRKLLYDDNRGLGEGVIDNQLTLSRFFLLLERHEIGQDERDSMQTISYPSILVNTFNKAFQHPIVNFVQIDSSFKFLSKFNPMKGPLPCDVDLLHLKTLLDYGQNISGVVMLLHRVGYECNFPTRNLNCMTSSGSISLPALFNDIKISSIKEMTLSLLHEKRQLSVDQKLQLKPMEIATYLVDVN